MSSKSSRGLKRRDTTGDASTTNGGGELGLDREVWAGPERGRTIYGELSAPFVSCRECGVSVFTGDVAQATHRDGCPNGEDR